MDVIGYRSQLLFRRSAIAATLQNDEWLLTIYHSVPSASTPAWLTDVCSGTAPFETIENRRRAGDFWM